MAKRATERLDESRVVGISLLVSISDVVLNVFVSVVTGSVVMMAQALQGLSDVITAGVLFLGVNRSRRATDKSHPLGYGREIFFWSMIAAVVMFIGTGGLSFYFGLQQFKYPSPLEYSWLAVVMLTFGLLTNSYAFSRSVKRLNRIEGAAPWWGRIVRSGMVETKTTFTVDFMGTLSALFGLIAILLYLVTGNVRFDGLGAMAVGLGTMVAAVLIMVDAHGLIVGRPVSAEINKLIAKAAARPDGVQKVVDMYTLYVGSDQLLVIVEVHLADGLSTKRIEKIIDQIKHEIYEAVPAAQRVQVEVETPDEEL